MDQAGNSSQIRVAKQGPGPARRFLSWLSGTVGRKADRSYRIRVLVQAAFALTCVVLGFQMTRFYQAALAGQSPLPVRPPGVEGFLPISGLMGLVDWYFQGSLNGIHPAATMLLLIALGTAVLLRKSFCSWICPIGFLSELLARLGRKIFGRNFQIPRWADIPLRGLKYLILGFFAFHIFTMGEIPLRVFLESSYNRVADVKMGLFFIRLGGVGLGVMAGLVVGSIFVQGFWCRYLCPYGALLGVFSWFSPARIRREPASCTDCGLCDRVCMARLPVSKKLNVFDPECTGCVDCVAVCPVGDTLTMRVGFKRSSVMAYALAVVLLFLAGYGGARAAGLWRNEIDDAEYIHRIQNLDSDEYGHPGVGSADGR